MLVNNMEWGSNFNMSNTKIEVKGRKFNRSNSKIEVNGRRVVSWLALMLQLLLVGG